MLQTIIGIIKITILLSDILCKYYRFILGNDGSDGYLKIFRIDLTVIQTAYNLIMPDF